jgi:RND superfamily putative drug exporter
VPNVVLLATAPGGDVDSPAAAAAGQALTDELAAEKGVTDVVSYWSEGKAPPLRSDDGSRALVDRPHRRRRRPVDGRIEELRPAAAQGDGDGGSASRWAASPRCSTRWAPPSRGPVTAEMIALPITLILLCSSSAARWRPAAAGHRRCMSIVGTFLVLQVMSGLTDVSIYALNLTTAWAWAWPSTTACSSCPLPGGAAGRPRAPPAPCRTVRTAGPDGGVQRPDRGRLAVRHPGLPLAFLRSFAYAGVAVACWPGCSRWSCCPPSSRCWATG